jgi:vancomycin resistance protein VanW
MLSERHSALYALSVGLHRAERRAQWLADRRRHAGRDARIATPFCLSSHSSVLLRPLAGVDMELQHNKVHNLEIAIAQLDGRILRPGERLSFWRCIGDPTARRGYLPGLVLVGGRLHAATGGGLCQLSNLIYWLALHTPLQIVERHHHGFDVFPDAGRVLPFGSGATVFYNYVDLVLENATPLSIRLNLQLTGTELRGEFRADSRPPLTHEVRESGHRFFEESGRWYRENRLHRLAVDRATGEVVGTQLITHNLFPVLYEVSEAAL